MSKGSKIVKYGKAAVKVIAPDVLEFGKKTGSEIIDKISTEFIEKQKNLIKIPDLKDVYIDEALRVLKDELSLIPTSAIANPSLAYVDEGENEVMYSEPRFGSRVNPGATVKVYYLTQDVIGESKKLLENVAREFKVPRIIGVNINEARADLESLGLKVIVKLEKPSLKFVSKEDGQVTRVTYPNDQKIGSKLRTGERIVIYYVNEEVILKSRSIKNTKDKDRREIINKIGKVTKDVSNGVCTGVVDTHKTLVKKIGKPFAKKKSSSSKRKKVGN